VNELEQRIDRIESRQAIGDLLAAYCSAVDAKDATRLGTLFDAQAHFGDLRGRKAIVDFFAGWMAEWGPSFHYPHALTLDFTSSDVATGVVSGHAEQRKGDEVWVMAIRYSDEYRREGGSWRFTRRDVGYVYRLRAQDYARFFGEVRR
jgi:ketosteroid isomerase-like protein